MAASPGAFEPVELRGDRYQSIRGSYGSLELAVEAEGSRPQHTQGGGESSRDYHSPCVGRNPTFIDLLDDEKPPMIQSTK
jgi:hypothetical protein